MKSILALVLAFCVAGGSVLKSRSGIVGGQEAALGEFPYQALVIVRYLDASAYDFGGTIITPTVVLTAAHCFFVKDVGLNGVVVDAGMAYRYDKEKQVIWGSTYAVHELYKQTDGLVGDIALLKLLKPFHFSFRLNAAKLPYPGQMMSGDCIATGFGFSKVNGSMLTKLQKVTVPIISDHECDSAFPKYRISERLLCAGYIKEGGRGSCEGDFGGPLTCQGRVAGVASFGNDCGRPNSPTAYTEVSYYIKWIHDQIDSWDRKLTQNNQAIVFEL